jgi:RNA polymerase sigma factor (sigma-70 family)
VRRETRQYICAELINYQRSKNEIQRICGRLDDLALWPAYSKDYTLEQRMYLQDRLYMLKKITDAISVAVKELSDEERAVLELKFWHARPRPTDNEIAERLGMSRSTLYRYINTICRKVGMRLGLDI